jgi:hypothetical protein
MTKHTPGPWHWWSQETDTDRPKNYDLDKILSENGDVILTIYGDQEERKEPNLQLLAAAPELLEELEKATRELHEAIYTRAANTWATPEIAYEHANKLTESYRAAIAKAKGES